MSWHTVTAIDDHTYRISEPLGVVEPRFQLNLVNSYLLIGREQAALIDSGMGIGDLPRLVRRLTPLPCQVLNTHSHWDHVGANARFERTAIHPLEEAALPVEPDMAPYRPALRGKAAQARLPAGFDADTYRITPPPATSLLPDGQEIDLGGRRLQVLHTPGHSPGHVAFFDPAAGQLFSGDLAYRGDIFACFQGSDPAAFQASVQRLAGLAGVRQICAGHEELINQPAWLDQLARAAEVALSGQQAGQYGEFIGGYRFAFADFALWLPAG